MTGGRVWIQRTLRCFGTGESHIERMIPAEIMRRGRDPIVGITASDATISLRVATFGDQGNDGWSRIQATVDVLRNVLGDWVYGVDDQTLADVVVAKLQQSDQSLMVADFGLDGLVGLWLSAADSERRHFAGCLSSLSRASAQLTLGIPIPENSISAPDLEKIATNIGKVYGVDIGLAIGALSHPNSAGADNKLTIAVAVGDRVESAVLPYGGHPAIRKTRAAKHVLNHLRLKSLLDKPCPLN